MLQGAFPVSGIFVQADSTRMEVRLEDHPGPSAALVEYFEKAGAQLENYTTLR
jgi:hypothetical protein